MKKLMLIVFALGFMATASHAQLVQVGLKGGLNATDFTINEIKQDGFSIEEGKSQIGYHAGLMARVNIPAVPIYIQPELLYTKGMGEYAVTNGNVNTNVDMEFSRLDIPVLVGVKMGKWARINAGPIASVVLAEENGFSELFDDSGQNFNSTTWGYQVGVGADFWRMTADLRYEGSLSDLGEEVRFLGNDYSTDTRTNQVILSIGYWF